MTPTELLMGTWYLSTAEGYDSTCWSQDYITCSKTYQLKDGVLSLTYDSLSITGVIDKSITEEYLYEFEMTINDWGGISVEETYSDLNGNILYEISADCAWNRNEKGAEHYVFRLIFSNIWNFTKVFHDVFVVFEDQIESNRLTFDTYRDFTDTRKMEAVYVFRRDK